MQNGRERVLREAMRLFGTEGVAGTSVRTIAAAAEVSPANVMHHFGTKDGLRQAIDDLILDGYRAVLTDAATALVAGEIPEPGDVVVDPAARAYLRRALLDGGPEPTLLVKELSTAVHAGLQTLDTQGQVRPGIDLDYASLQVMALLLGPLLLGPLLPDADTQAPSAALVQARAEADVSLLRSGMLRSLDTASDAPGR